MIEVIVTFTAWLILLLVGSYSYADAVLEGGIWKYSVFLVTVTLYGFASFSLYIQFMSMVVGV